MSIYDGIVETISSKPRVPEDDYIVHAEYVYHITYSYEITDAGKGF